MVKKQDEEPEVVEYEASDSAVSPNSTFATRAAGGKRIGTARNKAITAEDTKAK